MNASVLYDLLPYYLACFLSLGIAGYAWNQRRLPGAAGFAIFALGQSASILFYTFELTAPTLELKLWWDNVQWVTFMLTPLAWLHFTQTFLKRGFQRPRRMWVLVSAPLVSALVAIFSGQAHGTAILVPGEPFDALYYEFTPLIWGMIAYIYALYVANLSLLGRAMVGQNGLYRAQTLVIMTGTLIPLVGSIAALLLDITLAGQRDVTPLLFSIGNGLIAWGLFRFGLRDIVPMARNRLIESMNDIVIVVDQQNRVLDLNAAARRLAVAGYSVGDTLYSLFPAWQDGMETYQRTDDTHIEIVMPGSMTIDLYISPVFNGQNRRVGRVLVGREISDEVRLRNELVDTIRQLAETQERFDGLVNNLPGMAYTFVRSPDGSGYFSYISDRVLDVCGVTPAEVYANPELLRAQIEPPQENMRGRFSQQAVADVISYHSEIPKIINGEHQWHAVYATPKPLDDGSVIFYGIEINITERKKIEDSLRESEERFKRAFESAPMGKALVAIDGRFMQVNRHLEVMFGYSEAEMLTMTYQQISHPDDLLIDTAQAERLLRGEIPSYTIEKRYFHKDGHLVPTMLAVAVVRDSADKPLYYVSQLLDFTERKQIENNLRESEERFKSAFESSPMGKALVAPDGRFMQVNRHMEAMFGYSEAELLTMTYQQISYPDDLIIDLEYLERLARGEIPSYTIEKRYIHKDGHLVPTLLAVAVVRDAAGTPLYGVSQILDITERKQMENELRESEERFKSAFAFSPVGMTLVDLKGRFFQVNLAFCQIVGYTEAELLAMDYQSITHPDDMELDDAANQRILSRQIDNFSIEKRYIHQNGQPVWVQLNVSLVRDSDSQPLYYVSQILDITARKQMETTLRESEERFKGAFEFSPIGMTLVGINGRFLQVNRAFGDMLGYSEAELLATDFQTITYPPDLQTDVTNVNALIAGKHDNFSMEKRYIHKDGHLVWAQLNVSLVRAADDVPLYFVSQILDITERKQMEMALREREERFKSAFEFSPIGMTLVNVDGSFLQVNHAFCEMLGYNQTEMLATNFMNLTHPDDVISNYEQVSVLVSGEADNVDLEKRYFHKGGHLVWGQLNMSLVRDDQGMPLYFVTQILDITQRKQMETALRESEARFKNAFESSPIGMTLIDLDGRYLQVNRAFCQIVGYSETELLARSFHSITHPADTDIDGNLYYELHAGTIPSYTVEKRYIHSAGHLVWTQLNVSLVRDADGEALYFVSQVMDITERRAKEEAEREKLQLQTALEKEQELNELKTQMMIRIGHEFRLPLTVIQTAGEMLDLYLERMSPEKRHEKIEQIYEQVERLTQMLNDISYIVRGQAAVDLEMTDFAVLDVCEEAAAKHQDERDVRVRSQYAAIIAHADRQGIRTVLDELLSNALKYSPADSLIWIDVDCEGGGLDISVTDQGLGVPLEDQKRVFEPFFRSTNIGEIGGLGLGLTIVRDIVELHGGQVEVFSAGNQTGLCVSVRLPGACVRVVKAVI